MSNEVAVPSKAIDHVGGLYLQYREKRTLLEKLKKEVGELEGRLRDEVGEAHQATIFGKPVFTYKPINRFREKDFAADNPTLHKEYTKPVLVDRFDVDAFQEEHPNLYTQYQSRQFRVLDV